ncbi:hypothetical protein IB237_14805 [Agrobacterium sp. AGB01]|uniref:hypothetical protein n=1 Tax=Agrobacterium sp. AGB01 TaxID=2769302 RepID=UPI00177E4ED7|nr:hypothetical protein [Agrobacterium sp. AGB01]MBD9388452.1 hypothetical protein [Agrobacterium sp. AGB01]
MTPVDLARVRMSCDGVRDVRFMSAQLQCEDWMDPDLTLERLARRASISYSTRTEASPCFRSKLLLLVISPEKPVL